MANGEKNDKVVAMPDQKQAKVEVRNMTETQRANVMQLQMPINTAMAHRNAYIDGVAHGMELDGSWQFDFNGFLSGRNCRFVRQIQDEKKE